MNGCTPETGIAGVRTLTRDDVMRLTHHNDVSAFYQWARRAGLPMIKLSARRIVFEESAVRAWLDSRTIGKARLA